MVPFMIYSGQVSRISPNNSISSWGLLALDGDNIIAGRRKYLFWTGHPYSDCINIKWSVFFTEFKYAVVLLIFLKSSMVVWLGRYPQMPNGVGRMLQAPQPNVLKRCHNIFLYIVQGSLFSTCFFLKLITILLWFFAGFVFVGITTIWYHEDSSQGCLWEPYKRCLNKMFSYKTHLVMLNRGLSLLAETTFLIPLPLFSSGWLLVITWYLQFQENLTAEL